MGWVYGIQSGPFIKVGVGNSIQARLRTMNLYNPHPCKVVLRRQCDEPYFVEKRIHELLKLHSIGREWFAATALQVREAAKIAFKDLVAKRYAQIKWEKESAERAERRAVEKAANLGTERGKTAS
jgi:hypothetical protein